MKAALLLAVALASVVSLAQASDKLVSLEFKDAELRDVLKAAMRQAGASYSIAPGLEGKVTVSVKNRPLIHALRDVMLQVDGIYFIEAGIYMFRPIARREPLPPPSNFDARGGALIAPRGLRANSKDFLIINPSSGSQADVQLLLKELFNIARADFWMDRSLHGLVTVPPNFGADLEANLTAIAKQIGARWDKEDGFYVIRRADGRRM